MSKKSVVLQIKPSEVLQRFSLSARPGVGHKLKWCICNKTLTVSGCISGLTVILWLTLTTWTRGHRPGITHPQVSVYEEMQQLWKVKYVSSVSGPCHHQSTSEPLPWAGCACLAPVTHTARNNESFRHIFAPGDWTWRHGQITWQVK